jgi:hypothetical protein
MIPLGDTAVASSVSDLLVKAVRALPQEEQDAILAGLLDRSTTPPAFSAMARRWSPPVLSSHLLPDPAVYATNLRASERGTALRVVPVRLATEQHDALKQWCETNEFSMATVIRGLVDRFLETQSRPPTEDQP